MSNHYYILPDGRKAINRKKAKEILGISNGLFKSLREANLIKIVYINEDNHIVHNQHEGNETEQSIR